MDSLSIAKGGKLIASQYQNGSYAAFDATDKAPMLLFESCTLTDDVTLRDIFLLIERHVDVFEKLFGNWCREFTEEALSDKDFVDQEEDPLEYLELYHYLEVDEDNTLYGLDRPDLHGVGKNTAYSLSFLPTYKIAHLPVKLGPARFEDGTLHNTTYTLGKILYGILWELSFYGPPGDRDDKGDELKEIVKNIKG